MFERTADLGIRPFDPETRKDLPTMTRRQLLTLGGRETQAQAVDTAATLLLAGTVGFGAAAILGENLRELWTDGARRSEAERFISKSDGWLEGTLEIDLAKADLRTAPYVNQSNPDGNKVPLGQITEIAGKDVRGKKSVILESVPTIQSSDPEGRFGETSSWFIVKDTEEGLLKSPKNFVLFVSEKDDAIRSQGRILPLPGLGKSNIDQLGNVVEVK